MRSGKWHRRAIHWHKRVSTRNDDSEGSRARRPALPGFQFACAATTLVAVTVRRLIQPAGPTHRRGVISVDDATDKAYLVGLVSMPVHSGVRPGKAMPAAHFNKALENWIGHEILISPESFLSYSVRPASGASLLAIGRGIMASAWSHYPVTEGGRYVTVPRHAPGRTTGTRHPDKLGLPY